jgi:hypothetical protein
MSAHKERSTLLTSALLASWQQHWVNRTQPYAVQQRDGTYRWVYTPCTPAVLQAHLAGTVTVALSSTDAGGCCRWLCLDSDDIEALPHLLSLRTALAEQGLPGLVEASRRGGHLWLFLEDAVPAVAARWLLHSALAELAAGGVVVPAHELYPDTTLAGALGHAVRLPLGVHQLTGRRYPLFDAAGHPCIFTTLERAVRFVLAQPRAPMDLVRFHWHQDAGQLAVGSDDKDGAIPGTAEHDELQGVAGSAAEPTAVGSSQAGSAKVGTRSAIIRWVDKRVSPLELLADLTPEAAMRPVGRGYLGWCPFHDDQAPDEAGRPGTPSFYVVQDRRHGWSWRCLSSNCPQSWGPMRHPFELFQRLLGLTVRSAIVDACLRWPEAEGRAARTAAERTG